MELYSLVIATRGKGWDLITGKELEWEPDDPNATFLSRVIGEIYQGCMRIAIPTTDNVHATDWLFYEKNLRPVPKLWDWYSSCDEWKVSDKIRFHWEDTSFVEGVWPLGKEFWYYGDEVIGEIVAPHINYGDWIVSYQKPPSTYMKNLDGSPVEGGWITRVLNQRQMMRREG